jgi:hypothetical protein
MDSAERLVVAASLAHAAPGVVLRVQRCDGRLLTVARHCIGADLDPCQLRTALLAQPRTEPRRVLGGVVAVEVGGSVVDIGGGLYQRRSAAGADERWFATFVPERRVAELFAQCPVDVPDASVRAVLKPDAELGVMAVQLWCAEQHLGTGLDEVASWAVAACMVEELLGAATAGARP